MDSELGPYTVTVSPGRSSLILKSGRSAVRPRPWPPSPAQRLGASYLLVRFANRSLDGLGWIRAGLRPQPVCSSACSNQGTTGRDLVVGERRAEGGRVAW